MAADSKRSLDEVKRENEALEKELATLRATLGIDAKEGEDEKERVTTFLRSMDRKKESVSLPSLISEAADGIKIRLQLGDMRDVGLGLRLSVGSDAAAATSLRTSMEAPEGKNTFAFIDIGIADGGDEGKLGELVGIVEGLLSAAGAALNEKAGIPIYNSHTVRPTVDSAGQKVLRVAFFCELNPAELAAAQLGKDASIFSPTGLLDLQVALETSLNFNMLKDDEARVTLDNLRARLTVDGNIGSSIDTRLQEILNGLPGVDHGRAVFIGAAVKLFRGLNINIETLSLEDLKNKFTTPFNPDNLRGPHEALRHYGEQLATIPIKAAVNGMLGGMAAQFGTQLPPEVHAIYNSVRANMTGPKRIHVQVDDAAVELGFIGFDIFQFAPPLGEA